MSEIHTNSYVKAVARHYYALKNHEVEPSGRYEEFNMWFPSDQEKRSCCLKITNPSPRFPYTLLNHCKTIKHLAHRYGINEAMLRKEIRKLRVTLRNTRNWFELRICNICHHSLELRYTDYSPMPNVNGLSESTINALNLPFIRSMVDNDAKDIQRFRVMRFFHCGHCGKRFLVVCTNEVYTWNIQKEKYVKLRGYKVTEPKPTELIIKCPLCRTQLKEIRQYINNINGLNRNLQEIQKSKRMICERCKQDLNGNGFVYRLFEDLTLFRFCFSLNKWVPKTHTYTAPHRRETRNENRLRMIYNQEQTPINRIEMHIKTKSEYNIDKNGLLKELEPFKDILNEEEEVFIVKILEEIKPRMISER